MGGFKEYYSQLPSWSKGVIAVLGMGVIGFVGYKTYQAINKTTAEKKDKELASDINDEISKFKKDGLKQSFLNSEYLQDAETIHHAIAVCAGDDYSTAENVLKKMKNNLDVALLIKAFGKRQDYCFGIPTSEMNLFTYLSKELGSEWLGLTRYRLDRVNSDWKKKGITYKL